MVITRSQLFRLRLSTATTTRVFRSMSTSTEKQQQKEPFTLKVPKGTKDWADRDMTIRSAIFETLANVFKRHGAITIDTPVFELREVLTGKYGEDSKLIYNLEDQGGELTSLRYDLTVPFARYVAMNGIQNIKRYHIAKVYRRDQPAMTKGRMREFYQCDIDIAGTYDKMVPDSEVLTIAVEGLLALGIKDFTIKVNNRKLLDGLFKKCGVKDEDVRKVSSAVDKLDKSPWSEVKREMCEEKNQPEEVADRIGEYVQLKGDFETVLNKLASDEELMKEPSAAEGVEDMKVLLPYLKAFNVVEHLSFDLSLARGLDYYTGLIYEAVTAASAPPELTEQEQKEIAKKKKKTGDDDNSENVGVGSIAAGGRYDNLVGMFAASQQSSKKKKSAKDLTIPCVGISFGVERLFSIIKAREGLYEKARPTNTQVYVMAAGSNLLPERMSMVNKLWQGGIPAEFMYKEKVKWPKQCEACEKAGIPYAVILGETELAKGIVKVKEMGRQDANYQGDDVEIDQLVPYLKDLIAKRNDGLEENMKLLAV